MTDAVAGWSFDVVPPDPPGGALDLVLRCTHPGRLGWVVARFVRSIPHQAVDGTAYLESTPWGEYGLDRPGLDRRREEWRQTLTSRGEDPDRMRHLMPGSGSSKAVAAYQALVGGMPLIANGRVVEEPALTAEYGRLLATREHEVATWQRLRAQSLRGSGDAQWWLHVGEPPAAGGLIQQLDLHWALTRSCRCGKTYEFRWDRLAALMDQLVLGGVRDVAADRIQDSLGRQRGTRRARRATRDAGGHRGTL